jgi:uncharacterized iron-regulated protein
MRDNKLAKFFAWFVSVVLICAMSVYLVRQANSQETAKNYTQKEIIAELAKADIVYLGETHDSLEDHQAQLEIIKALHQKNPNLAIGMEMFQRPFQSVLDKYIAGEINERQLKEQSEYEERWGFDWQYYAPILQFAKANRLSLLALNTPVEITTKVSTQGLDSLTKDELSQIPSISEIRTDNRDYRQMLQAVYQQHMHGAHGNSDDFEDFFTTQVLWDETMAETIAKYAQKNPRDRQIVLAGVGHIIYGYGIPDRVARRLQGKSFQQKSVLLSDVVKNETQQGRSPADYIWSKL